MKTYRYRLHRFSVIDRQTPATIDVAVTFHKVDHWAGETDWQGHRMTAYEVREEDGRLVGTIERAIESTDRHYGRIRSPGKGRPAWQWKGPKPGDGAHLDGKRASRPGIYEHSRGDAVACLYGFSRGQEI